MAERLTRPLRLTMRHLIIVIKTMYIQWRLLKPLLPVPWFNPFFILKSNFVTKVFQEFLTFALYVWIPENIFAKVLPD